MRLLLLVSVLLASQLQGAQARGLLERFSRFALGRNEEVSSLEDVPSATLSNGVELPLVRLGVGNMLWDIVPAITSQALRSDKHIRLFDTSSVSQNEHLLAQGIVDGADQLAAEGVEKTEVHVITKVWYTHLGYERTLVAVKKSIDELRPVLEHPNVELKLHVLIHWPRCYDQVFWMSCEEEEEASSDELKGAGPPPHLDADNAWKGSWKALESLVKDDKSPVASIGVSNFHLKDLQALSEIATIQPHMAEINMWSLLYDPLLVDHCNRHNIHLTSFHILESSLRHAEKRPFAYHQILTIANEVTKDLIKRGQLPQDGEVTAVQIVLAWLIQHGVSVIPRTSDIQHLKENSAAEIQKIPTFTDAQMKTVAHAVEALISGDDLEEDGAIHLTFHAKTKDIWLYWRDDEDDSEDFVSALKAGEKLEDYSHPGHKYRIYDVPETGGKFETYQVKGRYGDHHIVEV